MRMNRVFEEFAKPWFIISSSIALLFALIVTLNSGPKTATVDAKHWVCSQSDTLGLEARCIQYTRVPSFQERN